MEDPYAEAILSDRRDQYATYPDGFAPSGYVAAQMFDEPGALEGVQHVQVNGFVFSFEASSDAWKNTIHREKDLPYEYIYLPMQFSPVCFGWRNRGETLWIGEKNRLHCGGPEQI